MKEEQEAREAEEAAKKNKPPPNRHAPKNQPAVNKPMKQTPPSNISMDDIEEFIEEGM